MTTNIDAIDTSPKRVEETEKNRHERAARVEEIRQSVFDPAERHPAYAVLKKDWRRVFDELDAARAKLDLTRAELAIAKQDAEVEKTRAKDAMAQMRRVAAERDDLQAEAARHTCWTAHSAALARAEAAEKELKVAVQLADTLEARAEQSELDRRSWVDKADALRARKAELEKQVERLMLGMELAWGVIANAGWRGESKKPGWDEAAARWRDEHWHPALAATAPDREGT